MLFGDKKDQGQSVSSWTITLDVKLQDRHAEKVTLTVHTQAPTPMTLEWPAFGGVTAGKANFVALPTIERVSKDPKATDSSPVKALKKKGSRMWSASRRQVDAESVDHSGSGSTKHSPEVAYEAQVAHRDATVEDVHAMVMAIVDQELRDGQRANWRPAAGKSLLTLRDSSGAMLVHNLLLAGAQVGYRVTVSYSPDPTPTPAADRQRAYQPMPVHITNPSLKP